MKLGRWWHGLEVGRRFLADVRPHRWRMLLAAGLASLTAACELLRPWPIQWIFDEALTPALLGGTAGPEETVVVRWGVLALALVVSAKAALDYFRTLALAQASHLFTRGLRHRVFSHLVRLSPLFHARHKSGDLLVRLMGDAPMVSTMMVESSVELATRTLLVVGTVVVMFAIDPLMATAVLLALPVVAWTVRFLSSRIRVAVRKQRKKEGDLADYLHEAIAATETIQSLGGTNHVVRRFARNNRTSARAGLRAKKISAKLTSSVEATLGLTLAGTLALGSMRVLHGQLTPGELLVFLSYVRSIVKPLRSASKHADRVAKGTACGERILDVLEEAIAVEDAPDAVDAPERPEELRFEDVVFRYEEGTQALQGFTGSFRRGQLSALVGRSGAGKSTAALLAMRLFDPQAGRILLDGRPLDAYRVGSLRTRVSLCLQETVLFGESIRENLLLGRPEATEEELWHALGEAGAAAFVRALPEDIDTPLGANGVGLSGGQRNRIALARTLLRGSLVLIVDEPFAGLDREAARDVAATLAKLALDRIVIVIAHDLEDLERFDHVLFIEEGRAVAEGSHAELVELPVYRQVVRTSSGVGS